MNGQAQMSIASPDNRHDCLDLGSQQAGSPGLTTLSMTETAPFWLSPSGYRTGFQRPAFCPTEKRTIPNSAAPLTRQKENGIPRMRGGLPFLWNQ